MKTKLQWSHGRLLNSAINFTKPKKNNKYFGGFQLRQEQKQKSKAKQNIFGFLNIKLQLENKANQLKKQIEKQRKYFWSFCVLET